IETKEAFEMQHPLRPRDAAGAAASGNVSYHGGPVLPASHAYTIFWGNPSAFPSDAAAGLGSFFDGLTGSSFLAVANQYLLGAASAGATRATSSRATATRKARARSPMSPRTSSWKPSPIHG